MAVFRIERNLIGYMPLDKPLGCGDELDFVFYHVAFFYDAFVVGGVALLDVGSEEIGIGASDDLLFVV